uniref:Cytochrome P450 n=1 Tax=Meloidogyne javanica TaxID=6303 RepID=A0A915LN11_MELJA
MDNFRALCYDLLLAGQETTGNTLSFLVLYLLLDQRVQSKLQAELDNLVEGNEELIGLSQRPQANYTNAVINEVQRLCNLLPLNLSHKTMSDVEIMDGKYFLKEGTVILPQISCLLYDEKVFPNPHLFIPERFLDDKGQLKRFDSFIPFGLGKSLERGAVTWDSRSSGAGVTLIGASIGAGNAAEARGGAGAAPKGGYNQLTAASKT